MGGVGRSVLYAMVNGQCLYATRRAHFGHRPVKRNMYIGFVCNFKFLAHLAKSVDKDLQKVHSSDDSLSLLLTMVPNLSIDKKLGFDIPKCAVSSPRIGIGQMDSKQEFFAPSDVRVMEHHHVQRDE